MFRPVSRVAGRMKAYGMTSLVQVGALLAFEPEPYYAEMKELANRMRCHYGLVTPRVKLADLRRIYRAQGISLRLWRGKVGNLRGAYFNDEWGVNVMVIKEPPEDPMVFTMAHELKHHLFDSDLKPYSEWSCDQPNPIEVGAEIFAGELIYPEESFRSDLKHLGLKRHECVTRCMLRLKRETRTTLPYKVLAERAVSMGLAPARVFRGTHWKRLEKKNW